MASNILITGAAGYIGGSLIADFLASNSPLLKKQNIIAAVRSEEQSKVLSKLGVSVLQLDLNDEEAVVGRILQHNIRIVIHTASSLNESLALHLITALGKQREVTGEETYFIHTSALSAFYPSTGWPAEAIKDTGPIFDLEKKLDSFAIRNTDVAVTENAKAVVVTSFIVIPCTVYGKGTGPYNKLSVVLPVIIASSISHKTVHKFPENTKVSGVHISDLTALYGLLILNILKKETIPSGKEGYYFALAHHLYWWEVMDHLASALKARNLLTNTNVETWPSDDVAAEAMGVPAQFVKPLWNDGENIIAGNGQKIGWKPTWDNERFLRNIDDEVQAVVDEGKAKSSLIGSLHEAARG